MTVSFELGETINGFTITVITDGCYYVAENEEVSIRFYTKAGSGINYYNVMSLTNLKTGNGYHAMRFLSKYMPTAQKFSNELLKRFNETK